MQEQLLGCTFVCGICGSVYATKDAMKQCPCYIDDRRTSDVEISTLSSVQETMATAETLMTAETKMNSLLAETTTKASFACGICGKAHATKNAMKQCAC